MPLPNLESGAEVVVGEVAHDTAGEEKEDEGGMPEAVQLLAGAAPLPLPPPPPPSDYFSCRSILAGLAQQVGALLADATAQSSDLEQLRRALSVRAAAAARGGGGGAEAAAGLSSSSAVFSRLLARRRASSLPSAADAAGGGGGAATVPAPPPLHQDMTSLSLNSTEGGAEGLAEEGEGSSSSCFLARFAAAAEARGLPAASAAGGDGLARSGAARAHRSSREFPRCSARARHCSTRRCLCADAEPLAGPT